MTKILLGWQKAAQQLDWIRSLAPGDCEFLVPEASPEHGDWDASPDELTRLAPEAEIIVGWNFPKGALEAATRMKLLSSAHTGVDRYDLRLFRDRGVTLANASGVNAVAVAEHAMALMLALSKKIVTHDASVRRVDWVDLGPDTAGMMLAGKTACVIGLGRIGKLVARRCQAFDMKVRGVKRDATAQIEGIDKLYETSRLTEALAGSQVVFLTLPLTPQTRGLMGPDQFAALPEGAMLINVGRGMVVGEAALYQALTTGRLGGFAADVWWDYADASPAGYHYNVPSRLHVQRLPNVVGTPDMASNVHGMRERMIEFAMENVREFLSGQTPHRAIDLEAGF